MAITPRDYDYSDAVREYADDAAETEWLRVGNGLEPFATVPLLLTDRAVDAIEDALGFGLLGDDLELAQDVYQTAIEDMLTMRLNSYLSDAGYPGYYPAGLVMAASRPDKWRVRIRLSPHERLECALTDVRATLDRLGIGTRNHD